MDKGDLQAEKDETHVIAVRTLRLGESTPCVAAAQKGDALTLPICIEPHSHRDICNNFAVKIQKIFLKARLLQMKASSFFRCQWLLLTVVSRRLSFFLLFCFLLA